ncbi:hypothetical protein BDZ97DRAFT_1931980 [Flammula alnicola]|nr:hypothetical protein BDZ97DRAFT_1931980 [Flammula alnicola]
MFAKICHQYASLGTRSFPLAARFMLQHISLASTVHFSSIPRRHKRTSGHGDMGPLAEFFAQYSSFNYDANNSATAEFCRMCFRWKKDKKEDAYDKFRIALTKQFNTDYGTDSDDINACQGLCARLCVGPIPQTLKECRRMVMSTHVNLVDLVDGFKSQQPVQTFSSAKELSEYTIENGKYFPMEDAYAGNLLKYLLRYIFDPSKNSGMRAAGSGGRRRRGGRKRLRSE